MGYYRLGIITPGDNMAKFQPILGNILGSIGGNTFSHNRGGPYIRRRSAPTNENSTAQQIVRAYLSTLTKQWQFLTPIEREAWNSWADSRKNRNSLGNDRHYTGHQMYISTNLRRLQMGLPAQAAPPTDDTPPSLLTLSINRFDLSSQTVEFAFTPDPLGPPPPILPGQARRLQAWQCKPYPGNRNPNFNQAYLMGYSATNPTSPQTFPLKFPLQAGDSVVFYVAVVSETGLQAPPLRVKVDSVSP